ncbi:MAG: hypothetical protein BROFUL_02315 [Candidatus Brocadia fulgida]|jgi:Glycosyltransferases involved in cell wall biogenesis|uniref:dolichyl-phosphate beta-glucosyltransferase n=1 Tax=Candidatus Brocadia fulgida TaxID=380242 RepID=A0A0M2US76_9BACT|nr:MAG: hypothetical protein BROFUL_02315 [Candidatus Brocadia fulgida]
MISAFKEPMNECLLSIVIPAYNEEKRLLVTVSKVCAYLAQKGFSCEIIVVDDGSTDNTAQIIKEIAGQNDHVVVLTNDRNYGKGCAVRKGMLSAKGEYVFFSDADLSTPIEEIEKFLPYLFGDYDVVIGSRSMSDSEIAIHQPWYRERMGKTFNFIVNLVLLKGIVDTQCGFKGFKKEAAQKVFSKGIIDGFSFDVEVLYLSRKWNFKIKEIPIRWKNSSLSKVKPVRHSLQMLRDLFIIKIQDFKGQYR